MWLVYGLIAAMAWGLNYTLGEQILQKGISPTTLLLMELFPSLFIFLVLGYEEFHLKKNFFLITHDSSLLWMVLATIIAFSAGSLLTYLSIQLKNATVTSLIELSFPLFTIVFTFLLFRINHFTLPVLIGGALIMAGVFVIGYF